jgi:light-regulated signal transduction histidine kinase (bacteriophytochrome)
MEKLAREVFEEFPPAFAGKVTLDIGPLPRVRGDRTMMRQVFVNLLSNAIKYSGIKENATIQVGGSVVGDEAICFVKDNGVGFDMQYVDRLFGVFQRLHRSSDFEGTGIGLAIVKRVVTRHGGRVWAEGEVGKGATFYFALPICAG